MCLCKLKNDFALCLYFIGSDLTSIFFMTINIEILWTKWKNVKHKIKKMSKYKVLKISNTKFEKTSKYIYREMFKQKTNPLT